MTNHKMINHRHGTILLDDADYESFSKYKVQIDFRGGGKKKIPYACIYKDKRRQDIHRIIMNAKKGEIIDHINRNSLDNRRSNLRIASSHENGMNRGMQSNNKSGESCVHWSKPARRWRVRFKRYGKIYNMGEFKDFSDAVKVRDEKLADDSWWRKGGGDERSRT